MGRLMRPMVPRRNLAFAVDRAVSMVLDRCPAERIRGMAKLKEALQAGRQTGLTRARDITEEEVRDILSRLRSGSGKETVCGLLHKLGLEVEFIPR